MFRGLFNQPVRHEWNLERLEDTLNYSLGSDGIIYEVSSPYTLPNQTFIAKVQSSEKFKNELSVYRRLSTAKLHIPKIIDVVDGVIIMQKINGLEGRHYEEKYEYDQKRISHYLESLYQAVTEMIKVGVYHNDLNTRNVLIEENTHNVYIIDFSQSSFSLKTEDYQYEYVYRDAIASQLRQVNTESFKKRRARRHDTRPFEMWSPNTDMRYLSRLNGTPYDKTKDPKWIGFQEQLQEQEEIQSMKNRQNNK